MTPSATFGPEARPRERRSRPRGRARLLGASLALLVAAPATAQRTHGDLRSSPGRLGFEVEGGVLHSRAGTELPANRWGAIGRAGVGWRLTESFRLTVTGSWVERDRSMRIRRVEATGTTLETYDQRERVLTGGLQYLVPLYGVTLAAGLEVGAGWQTTRLSTSEGLELQPLFSDGTSLRGVYAPSLAVEVPLTARLGATGRVFAYGAEDIGPPRFTVGVRWTP